MKILRNIAFGLIEILLVLLLSLLFTQVLSSCHLALANTGGGSASSSSSSPAQEQKVEKVKRKKAQHAEEPKPMFFVDWAVPDFDFALRPILGVLYESIDAPAQGSTSGTPTQQMTSLTGELGLRAGLENVSLAGDSLKLTTSPEMGYAYGRRMNLERSSQVQEGGYHRMLIGNTARLYLRFLRYSLGVKFGRIFGDRGVAVQLNQGEVMQDLGLKTTASSSVHATFTVGRSFADSPAKFLIQRSDLWLHLLLNPVSSLSVDFGPGKEFTRLPQAQESFSNTYFKVLTDLSVYENFGLAGGMRYVFSATASKEQSEGQNAGVAELQAASKEKLPREPFRDLGSTQRKVAARPDDASAYFFIGLQRLYSAISLGYLCNYDFTNTFERNGKREKAASQSLGVFTQLEL